LIIIADNASYHRSKPIKDYVANSQGQVVSIVAKVRALVLYISTYPVDATNEEGKEEINASRTGPV
jgi:hypothetical protein